MSNPFENRPAIHAEAQKSARSTKEWQQLDAAHHIHPFSDMAALNKIGSRVITHAQGVHLFDSEGHKIIDGMAGLWCVNVGYGRKELAEVAYKQMLELPYYNTFFKTTHPPVIELSQLLSEVTPASFNHFFYCNSGSEGNDTVMRLTHKFWEGQGKPGKKWFISRKNGYHGSTIAGASLGGMGYMHEQMPNHVPFIAHINQPYWYAEGGDMTPEEFGKARAAELEAKILELGADNVAAFIGEPFQGAGGVIFPPETYWPEIERICRKHDILLVADEVIGGFGRTGQWFAHQHFGFTPDLMTLAKGLSSGYVPIGAVAIGKRVAEGLLAAGDFNHGLTYSGHPVAAAVAVANIKLLRDEGIIDRVRTETGPYFQKSLREALAGSPLVGEVQGAGLVAGIQMTKDKATRARYEDPWGLGNQCRDHCFRNNLIMRATADRMLLSPPLVINKSEIDELVEKASRCIGLTAKDLGVV